MAQERWDSYGQQRLESIQREPEKYVVDAPPATARLVLPAVGDVRGKRVLDLGCGRGEWAVYLAKQGADVTAVDLGGSLLRAGEALAGVNGVTCRFEQADITALPFGREFDVVTGLAILHHLTKLGVRQAVAECHRVLKPGGRALFVEPIENSRAFDLLQNLIPTGGKNARPSILARTKWKEYVARLDDRTMTDVELRVAGKCFDQVEIEHRGLLVRLARIVGRREELQALDRLLLSRAPWLGRYSQTAVVTYASAAVQAPQHAADDLGEQARASDPLEVSL